MMQDPPPTKRIATLCLSIGVLTACANNPIIDDYEPDARIGTYDGRAVAIAYANSDRFDEWMKEFRARHARAKAAGDEDTMHALEAQIQEQQNTFHGQAFRGDSIDDILTLITGDTQRIAREVDATRLERINLRRPTRVATVDVTDRLVALFEPDERTTRWIHGIRDKPFPRRP